MSSNPIELARSASDRSSLDAVWMEVESLAQQACGLMERFVLMHRDRTSQASLNEVSAGLTAVQSKISGCELRLKGFTGPGVEEKLQFVFRLRAALDEQVEKLVAMQECPHASGEIPQAEALVLLERPNGVIEGTVSSEVKRLEFRDETGAHSIPEARSRGVAGWGPPQIVLGVLASIIVGLGIGQLFIWWGAHQTLSSYIAFIPGNMQIAGLPEKEIRVAVTRSMVESLKRLLEGYDRLCRDRPYQALARNIDCDRVHKMSEEPIPEN
jgi:hypothetical protein